MNCTSQRAPVPVVTKVKNGTRPGGAGGTVVDCWTAGCACSQAPSSAQLMSASAAVGMATAARNSAQSIGRVFMLPPLIPVSLEILLHVIRRVLFREPAIVHQLLKPVLDFADVLTVVLVELVEHFLRKPRLISGLVAERGATVGNGVRKQRHIEISRVAEVLEIRPARSRPDSGLHLARAGD